MFEKISKISVAALLITFFCVDLLPQHLSGHSYDLVEIYESMKGDSEKENKEPKSGREVDEYVTQSFLPYSCGHAELYLDLTYLKRGYLVPVLEGPFLPPEVT